MPNLLRHHQMDTMNTRRDFLKNSAITGLLSLTGLNKLLNAKATKSKGGNSRKPIVISTWKFGLPANQAAWKILSGGGRALDAVEKGVRVTEADLTNSSVGLGGLPDRDGFVTLDASIMDEKGNAGAVAYLQHILHPISVARLVMEKTPHVLLAGDGALQFALENGFKKHEAPTPESQAAYLKWKKENEYSKQSVGEGNHDTIGMLAMDSNGNLSGACTTSGLAWKYHGRIGDSPIPGDGMFVDNEIGAACSTGKGEAAMKICGSMLVVEMMRNGNTPQQACMEAIIRVASKQPDHKTFQLAFLAINKNGEHGAFALQNGFSYALTADDDNTLYDSDYMLK